MTADRPDYIEKYFEIATDLSKNTPEFQILCATCSPFKKCHLISSLVQAMQHMEKNPEFAVENINVLTDPNNLERHIKDNQCGYANILAKIKK